MSSISYDLKKIRAFAFDVDGVLSPSTIPMSTTGEPLRMVNIKDGFALQLAARLGYMLAIFTGGNTEAVRIRFESLGIRNVFLGAAHKLPLLKEWMESRGLIPEEVVYVGDDIPDVPCLQYVGLPCAPADAAPEAIASALYISPRNGGYGVGRDIVEQTLKAQDNWLRDADSFGW